MTKRYLPLLAWLAVVGLPSGALTQPVGPEFQVNTYTTGSQQAVAVASDASGNFVVVWESDEQDGDRNGVFGRRYDRDGNALGGEFQVNTYTTSLQSYPSVASDANGNFVVVWSSFQDGSDEGIFGQRYDSDGNPLAGEFQVNTYTTHDQTNAAVASDANGNFVVIWGRIYPHDPNFGDVFGQRYDSSGNALGSEFQVNTYTKYRQSNAAVASDASGGFVVVWTSNGQDGNSEGIFGQRFDSSGNPLGGEFQVNTFRGSAQDDPSVSSDATGNFVVVWKSYRQDGDSGGIFGQRFDSSGNPVEAEFQVNTYTTGQQEDPSVLLDASGNFVVIWQNLRQDVFGQRFDNGGSPIGGEFLVNTYTTSFQKFPSVSSDASGNFVVVWQSRDQDGSDEGVFGQRFSAGCEASVQIQGDVNAAGTIVPVQVHIGHHSRKTVTVRWKLSLLDGSGQAIAEHISQPHTFKPGDVLDQEVKFQLPDDLASGEYTLDLAVKRMAGTKGATTTLRVVRTE